MEEIVARESEDKLLVPQRREMCETEERMSTTSTLKRIASTVSPTMPAFQTVEARGYLTKFNTGRLIGRKGTLLYTFYYKRYSFHIVILGSLVLIFM